MASYSLVGAMEVKGREKRKEEELYLGPTER